MRHITSYKIFEDATLKMYHVSHVINRKSILKNGLNSSGVSPWDSDSDPIDYPKGTYLWDSVGSARKYGFGNGDPFDIWEISVDKYKVENDTITAHAYYIKDDIDPVDIRIAESHEKDVSNPITESYDDALKIKSGAMVLIRGKKLEDGTSRLYASGVKNTLNLKRLHKNNEPGISANMIKLGPAFYRIRLEGGKLVANKVADNAKSMKDVLGLRNEDGNVTLNAKTGKTPLWRESSAYESPDQMIHNIGGMILSLDSIRWSN